MRLHVLGVVCEKKNHIEMVYFRIAVTDRRHDPPQLVVQGCVAPLFSKSSRITLSLVL